MYKNYVKMITAILNFFNFFGKLNPSKMINIVLLGVIFYMAWHSNNLEIERDNYKDRYEKVYDKYTNYVNRMQDIRDKQTVECNEILRGYTEKKNQEIEDLSRDFKNKYLELLKLYTDVLQKRSNDNENTK